MIPIAKPLIGQEEIDAVTKALSSGQLAQGERTATFEKAFAEHCGARHAIACSNGTTAIHLALLAHGVGPRAEVIAPSFSFIATVTPVLFCGAKPRFVDVDGDTFNVSVDSIKKAIGPKTKAIIPVHLYGLPVDMAPIRELAEAKGIPVIEDACQAHGAAYHGKRVGSLGDSAAFSFYPTKNMTCGEGGMVTTNSDELAEKLRLLRSHGQKSRYEHVSLGYNYRMTDIAASIGIEQLKKLDGRNEQRRRNAAFFDGKLGDVVTTPKVPAGRTHVYHQYTVLAKDRDGLVEHLKAKGIGTGVYYPVPIHRQPVFGGAFKGKLPVTERLIASCVSLPVHPALSQADLETVVSAIRGFCGK